MLGMVEFRIYFVIDTRVFCKLAEGYLRIYKICLLRHVNLGILLRHVYQISTFMFPFVALRFSF